MHNDDALSAFILRHVSPTDIDHTNSCSSAHQLFECLRVLHENQGAYAQISLLIKALDVCLSYDTPLRDTLSELRSYYHRIVAMGKIKDDDIFAAILLHSMSGDFLHLQQSVQNMTHLPNFNSEMIARRILEEDTLIRRRKELGQWVNPNDHVILSSQMVHVAQTRPRAPKPFCTNCKKDNHTVDFCISVGGKMAGRTAEEAKAAYRAKNPRPPRPAPNSTLSSTSAHVATPTTTAPVPSPSPAPPSSSSPFIPIIVNGISYIPDPSWSSDPSPPVSSAYITEVPDFPGYDYHAFLALLDNNPSFSALSTLPSSPSPHKTIHSPFILDSGAACHLSLNLSDFKTLCPIVAHPIKGVGNSIAALGMGTIEINCDSGQLVLHDAYYVPMASARLISIWLLLHPESKETCHALFHPDYFLIFDTSNRIICRGIGNSHRRLYFLSDFTMHVPPSPSSPSLVAHYASRPPDLDSWHKCLGHCGIQTILNMACSLGPKLMPIDLSHPASKCAACILGKQTWSSVSKIWEGPKAVIPLEHIYVDLCGPMSVASRSGRLYSMNVIDDYFGFIWSLPLRSKGEASIVMKHWLTAMENQTPHRLECLITDNGELSSIQIWDLCTKRSILHLFTAPYTSTQNGRAERLHRTIMDCAHATRISCNAPPDMWDKFCATAAYLHNLTGTSANNGKSPYQLWHSKEPPLLHLHEIGCCAFSLITTNNPKVLHHSIPCILIGYAPNAKAYWLWDPTTNRIFNSFHVSFIKARQLPPPPDILTSPPSSMNQQPDRPLQVNYPHPSNITFPICLPPSDNTFSPSTTAPPTTSTPTVPFNLSSSHKTNIPFYTNTDNIPSLHCSPSNPYNHSPNDTTSVTPPTLPLISNSVPDTTIHDRNNTIPSQNPPTFPQNNNTVPHENTVLQQKNTVPQQENTFPQITILPQATNLPQENVITHPSLPVPQQIPAPIQSLLHTPSHLPIPSSCAFPCRSARLAGLQPSSSSPSDAHTALVDYTTHDYSATFLSEFSPLHDSHFLLPVTLDPSFIASSLSLGDALTALATGGTELTLDLDDDPLWATAIASLEHEYWIAGARDELQSLKDRNVFVLVPHSDIPRGQQPLKGKLVCKQKRDDAGNITCYKVRYVAKGFAQRYLIDYEKTTAPTACLESFRTLMHIATCLDWDIQHFDIKTAFLHGVLPEMETVFMEQPPGFEEPEKSDWVWCLSKSLYSMKQASWIWNQTFHKTMVSIGFKHLANEWCVYQRKRDSGITIFAVHVDDIISISSSHSENNSFKAELQSHWDISDLRAVKFALRTAISCDRSSCTIHLSQTALIDHVIDQFGQFQGGISLNGWRCHPCILKAILWLLPFRKWYSSSFGTSPVSWLSQST